MDSRENFKFDHQEKYQEKYEERIIKRWKPFQRAWYLKFHDPEAQKAFWLKMCVLSSQNGFSRVAEIWAVYFERSSNKSVKKIAVKQTFPIQAFSTETENLKGLLAIRPSIRIAESVLASDRTQGSIYSKGTKIEWDFNWTVGEAAAPQIVPKVLSQLGIIQTSIVTPQEELFVTGKCTINGQTLHWKDAPGMQGHAHGTKLDHSWVWAHCNIFKDSEGKYTPFLFEGFSVRANMGFLTSPRIASFYFFYRDQTYLFNHLRDSLHMRSKLGINEWSFRVDRKDLSFRGHIQAEHKDFAGLTYEDTQGSLLYSSHTQVAHMKIFVYRAEKLEASFTAHGTAGFEIVAREPNPYVPRLI